MGDWLGTGTIAPSLRQHRSFDEARKFAHSLKLKSGSEWSKYCQSGKKPNDIPANPNQTYKNVGWISMGDWLGTGTIAPALRQYRSFIEAKTFVHSLHFKGQSEWFQYSKSSKKPLDIPTAPSQTYKNDGWISWGDWLGTGRIAHNLREHRSFVDAREFVHSLKLNSSSEWWQYCKSGKKPEDIPIAPSQLYSNKGWISWGDWLGTGRIADRFKEYRPFTKARKFVHSLRLKSSSEWHQYCKSGKKPEDIPAYANQTYKNEGWINMGDWLGTGRIATFLREYRSFVIAKKFIHSLNLKSQSEWAQYCKSGKKPEDIPSDPIKVYKKDGWISWGDWLGKKVSKKKKLKGS